MAKLVGRRYAEALRDVALELNKLTEFKEEIVAVCDIFTNEPKLKTIFEHPKVSKDEKKDIMSSLFKDRISKEMLNLIYIIIDKGRMRDIDDIKNEYIVLSNKELNIVEAKAFTAVVMTEEERLELQEKLSKKLSKNIILENIVDKEVMGGVLVKIQDKVIDGSLKGQLEKLERELKNIRVEKIGVK